LGFSRIIASCQRLKVFSGAIQPLLFKKGVFGTEKGIFQKKGKKID
jgi:hypothetical protein